MGLHDDIYEMVAYVLNEPDPPVEDKLYNALRLLCKYRTHLMGNTLVQSGGSRVRSGPFKGLVLSEQSAEGSYVPKLLGTYEQELHGIILSLTERGYEVVINIGCAEGFYAVGLARLLGNTVVDAYDTDPNARRTCSEVAEINGLQDRVRIHGALSTGDFRLYEGKKALVVCDIEGAEVELLDPVHAPALQTMDILVETHDVFASGCKAKLCERFRGSHSVEVVTAGARDPNSFKELHSFDNLDRLLAVWEWRLPGNEWLWLKTLGVPFAG